MIIEVFFKWCVYIVLAGCALVILLPILVITVLPIFLAGCMLLWELITVWFKDLLQESDEDV